MDRVLSLTYQSAMIAASTTTKNAVEATYGMPSPTCRTSAAIVPNTLTMTTAAQ